MRSTFGPSVVRLRKILHADGAAPDLVLVGRPDAASGGADFGGARRLLANAVELAVQRQDQDRILGDA